MSCVLVIPDTHAPFMHPDAVAFLRAIADKYNPNRVLLSGDEADYHNISFHPSSPNLHSAGKELELAIEQLSGLYELFPRVTVLESNHGSMVKRRALFHGLPSKVFRNYGDILDAPKGWEWVPDLYENGIYYCHGKTGIPGKLAMEYGVNCVQGHFHEKFHITWRHTPMGSVFDMHVGCLIDDNSPAFDYNKRNIKKPVLGAAIIVNGIPTLIPMICDKDGRWCGSI